MGVPLAWVTEWDLMVGMDGHNEITLPIPPAAPSPMHKHIVAATMRWAANAGEWSKQNVFIEGRLRCKHFHDIAYLIPHIPIPPNGCVLLPVIIGFSSSKIALGSFSVYANGDPA